MVLNLLFFTSTVGYEALSRGNKIAALCVKNEVVRYESKMTFILDGLPI